MEQKTLNFIFFFIDSASFGAAETFSLSRTIFPSSAMRRESLFDVDERAALESKPSNGSLTENWANLISHCFPLLSKAYSKLNGFCFCCFSSRLSAVFVLVREAKSPASSRKLCWRKLAARSSYLYTPNLIWIETHVRHANHLRWLTARQLSCVTATSPNAWGSLFSAAKHRWKKNWKASYRPPTSLSLKWKFKSAVHSALKMWNEPKSRSWVHHSL